jgi:hypothetical protein
LDMARSILRISVRRALDEHHPTSPWQIIDGLEAVVRHRNDHPPPFVWGGNCSQRRKRDPWWEWGLHPTMLSQWQRAGQLTHEFRRGVISVRSGRLRPIQM